MGVRQKWVRLGHEDNCSCSAVNKYGSETASSTLTVRRPTRILTPPERDKIANVTNDLRLPCEVRTDSEEREILVVEWRRDGMAIVPSRDSHLAVDSDDFSPVSYTHLTLPTKRIV